MSPDAVRPTGVVLVGFGPADDDDPQPAISSDPTAVANTSCKIRVVLGRRESEPLITRVQPVLMVTILQIAFEAR
jgi:hypothetical protein